jgi:hypothetical protein
MKVMPYALGLFLLLAVYNDFSALPIYQQIMALCSAAGISSLVSARK